MCAGFKLLVLSLAVSVVHGVFLLKEKKDLIICKKICPLYCKDIYKPSQRRYDDTAIINKGDPSYKYNGPLSRDIYNFYFCKHPPGASWPLVHVTTEKTPTTTEEPTLICMGCLKKCPPPEE